MPVSPRFGSLYFEPEGDIRAIIDYIGPGSGKIYQAQKRGSTRRAPDRQVGLRFAKSMADVWTGDLTDPFQSKQIEVS